jgi:hypothetical protein
LPGVPDSLKVEASSKVNKMSLWVIPLYRSARIPAGLALVVALFWSGHHPVGGAKANPLEPETLDALERERQYLDSSAAAMTAMMRDMQATGSGDVDRDFVTQMAAHHQGAIDMARAMLRTGRNQRLIRLAHEIIVTQSEEIVTMRLAITEAADPVDKLPRRNRPAEGDGPRDMP